MHLAMKRGTTSHPLASSPLFLDLAQGLTAQQSGSWNQPLTAALDPCVGCIKHSLKARRAVPLFDPRGAYLQCNVVFPCEALRQNSQAQKRVAHTILC
jgi:hypothetical protein